MVNGAEGTIYAGESFTLQFKFSTNYPLDSPEVKKGIHSKKYIYQQIQFIGHIHRSRSHSPTHILQWPHLSIDTLRPMEPRFNSVFRLSLDPEHAE